MGTLHAHKIERLARELESVVQDIFNVRADVEKSDAITDAQWENLMRLNSAVSSLDETVRSLLISAARRLGVKNA